MIDFISISDALKQSYQSEGILIDVRSEEEYRKGHLPMAENIPLTQILEGNMRESLKEKYQWKENMPVFFYCDTGSSSMIAARKAKEEDIKTYSVAGGILSYKGYLEKEEEELWTMVLVK